MTEINTPPPTVWLVQADHGKEIGAYATEQAAYAAIGRLVIDRKLNPEIDLPTVVCVPVAGAPVVPAIGTPTGTQPYPVQRPDWLAPAFGLQVFDDNGIEIISGEAIARISVADWTDRQDEQFAQYLVDIVNTDLAVAWTGGQR